MTPSSPSPDPGPEPRAAVPRIRQVILIGVGWTIIVLAVAVAPLPGPLGLPMAVVGATILMRVSPNTRRSFVRLKRRAPSVLNPVIRQFNAWRGWQRRRRLPRG